MTNLDDVIREGSMEDLWDMWFSELHKKSGGLTLKIKKILFSGQSDFQQVDVFDTQLFGKVLVLYGSIMITEKDEFVYHEMISHVPLCVHPAPKKVLIIGGGDGGTVREVVKHPKVEKVTLIEIDKMVVDVCKEYFPEVSCEFSNPKVEVLYDDGARFMAESKKKFDLVIVDSSDPVGPAEVLFQRAFYQNIYDRLEKDGIFIAQTESPFFNQETIKKVYRNLRAIFPIAEMYTGYVPTYPSGLWSFSFSSKRYHPLKDLNRKYFADLKINTKYYNSDVHEAAFKLPNFAKELLE